MILEWKPFDMKKGGILGQLLWVEGAFLEYEKAGAKLEDTIKFAFLMKCVSGELQTWLQLNVAESQDYGQLREVVIQYDTATWRWSSAMMLGGGGPHQGQGRWQEQGQRRARAKAREISVEKERVRPMARAMMVVASRNPWATRVTNRKGKYEQLVKTCFTCGN